MNDFEKHVGGNEYLSFQMFAHIFCKQNVSQYVGMLLCLGTTL